VLVAPPRPKRRGLRAFLIVAGIFAACCAGGATLALLTNAALRDATANLGAQPAQADTPAPAVTTTTNTQPARGHDQAGLNTPVRDGKFEFVVTAITCGQETVGTAPITRQAKGQYCVVDLSVENIGNKDQLLVDGAQKAIGPDGTQYGPDTGAGLIANANTSVWLNVVKPGAKVTGKMVYDIPDGVHLASLELHDSVFSKGVTITL
jgi:hypothetical protein